MRSASEAVALARRHAAPVVTAAAVFLSAMLSLGLGVDGALVLWLPTAVAFAACLSRGAAMAIPAAAGAAAWAVSQGASWQEVAWLAAACSVPPALSTLSLRAWGRVRPSTSQFTLTIRLLAVSSLVQAPLAAVAHLQARWFELPILPDHPWLRYASAVLIEAMGAVVAVRALLAVIPERGGSFCPVEALRGSGGVGRAGSVTFGALGAFMLLSMWAASIDAVAVVRLMLITMFAVGLLASLVASRRVSSIALLATTVVVVGLRLRIQPVTAEPAYLIEISQLVLLLFVGGALLHLLNAISSERILQAERLQALVLANENSGLPNLRALRATLQAAFEANRPVGAQLIAARIVDIDRLEDLVGREAANRFERSVGEGLRDAFAAEGAFLAHLNGGRFVLALEPPLPEKLLQARVRGEIDRHALSADGHDFRLRSLIGVVGIDPTVARPDPDSGLAALSMAEQRALASPDRCHVLSLSPSLLAEYRSQLRGGEEVREAVEHGRLRLLAQPIVAADPTVGGALHFEVLSRLLEADGAEMSPARFLPVLSRLRLLEQFDRLVVERVIGALHADRALYDATAACAINVTGPTIGDPAFPDFLLSRIAQAGLDPSRFVIEITESDSIASVDVAARNAALLMKAGVAVALDDFGTGLASFDYLRRFAPKWLKIDGSFVRSLDDGPLSATIIESVVRVARSVGAQTVAECVETQAQADRLEALGVDWLQGYLFARPMPVPALRAFARHGMPAHGAPADGMPAQGAPAQSPFPHRSPT